jgi:CyaY protein
MDMTKPSVDSGTPAASALTDAQYHQLTGEVLGGIESVVDQWLDADVIDIDSHRTGGLLELSFPGGSKIIINTQPPLHELWMAAQAGGFHYRHVDGQWRDTRNGEEFFAALSAQASRQAGKPLTFRG